MTRPDQRLDSAVDCAPRVGNADYDWDAFDSADYFAHNYGTLRADDERIIEIVADFFQSRSYPQKWNARAIDVGAGANLYPALAMLPFAAEVILYERAFSNRQWLENQIDAPFPSWWQFWSHMTAGRGAYQPIKDPFDLLSRQAKVVKGNIFSLRPGQFDMATMFFVAESITTRSDEFVRAAQCFVNSLVPRGAFAAAFMRNSSGYRVGDRSFPACSVDEQDVLQALAPVATDVRIQTVESKDLREGYCGMIVATGHKRRPTDG
ncbi:SCO2525 family SAM-dependent methyltransferase [Actinoplanes sp. NPDC026623]|uniref:SCO2525 family SAM-dependent methyltransferase n=1 Tax=Actinoplanes sp. NPDC026623 TaxID=3155610 RepID=UPI00340C5D5F